MEDCVPELEIGEGLPEPEGGWVNLIRLPEGYTDPEGLGSVETFPADPSCLSVDDGRPSLSNSCQRLPSGARGNLLGDPYEPMTYEQLHPEPWRFTSDHPAGTVVSTYVPCAGCWPYRSEATYDDRGRIIEVKETDTSDEHLVRHWRRRFACDGRPVGYDVLAGWAPGAFLYDAKGRPTLMAREDFSEAMAWYPSGALRARKTRRVVDQYTYETTVLLDEAGLVVAAQDTTNHKMGDTVETTLFDRAGGRTWRALEYPDHHYWRVSARAEVRDSRGRWLGSETVTSFLRPESPPQRSVLRNTLSCESGEPVRGELDADGDGFFDEAFGYEWEAPLGRIRTTRLPDDSAFEYRFDCDASESP